MIMVSINSLEEKYNQVKRSFCFYLDVQDNGVSRTLSKRIADLGLQQEVFLTARVTHVVRDAAAASAAAAPASAAPAAPASAAPASAAPASAAPASTAPTTAPWRLDGAPRGRAQLMLQRIRLDDVPPVPHTNYTTISVHKAVLLLDKIYDTFFCVKVKKNQSIKIFKKHYIKIEFLDKICRPVYKEFDEWPEIPVDPDPPKEKVIIPQPWQEVNTNLPNTTTETQRMTRKSRPRIKEREEEPKGGYCEMCNTDYIDAALHRRSPHHLAFVRDHTNFLSLDSLIDAGADVSTFLDKATPINGERRSLRKLCNGDSESKSKRSKRSQSPDSTTNGNQSPKRNGTIERHNTRCSKRISESQLEDRQYYKVVSTKLRSSGGFPTKRKDSPPTCNGGKPIVVKFRKVRRSELSVLSDEAEQFMFPKRASSTSSTSSNEDEEKEIRQTPRKSTPEPSPTLERRRLARPLALKEESSEEDSWPEDKRRRKRRGPPVVKRARRVLSKLAPPEAEVATPAPVEPETPPSPAPAPAEEVSPLREEPVERCMKWEDGKLKYTPAVEQLEFAFESVPQSEPWFETFKRQDEDKVVTKNVPRYFSLYTSKSPKLPYEIGQLPPLKPNCCPLSDLVKRDEKAGPSRSYGTRGMKRQKIRKKTAAATLLALESHPRKSPREHASTLAILGSAGLRKPDDTKSTASEDTVSETQSNMKLEPVISETQEVSERLQQFLSEVFDDAAEYDMSDEVMEGEAAVTTSTNVPDVLSLVSECEGCEIIRDEIREGVAEAAARPRGRRGKHKKKNRTGWPLKKKQAKKTSEPNSPENKAGSSLDGSSTEHDDDTTQESGSEAEEPTLTETDGKDDIPLKDLPKSEENTLDGMEVDETNTAEDEDSDDKPLQLDIQVLVEDKEKKAERDKRASRSSASESEEKEEKSRKKRSVAALGNWLQPVVRVARVDPNAARRLRSAGRGRSTRFR